MTTKVPKYVWVVSQGGVVSSTMREYGPVIECFHGRKDALASIANVIQVGSRCKVVRMQLSGGVK